MSTNIKWEFQARKLVEFGKYDVNKEYSDKGIIDMSVLEPVINLGIPEPWTFKAVNIATEGTEYEKVVYFGVESFDDVKPDCFLPRFRDSSSFVTVTPVIDPLPKGTFCKLKPQNERFLTLLNELGPKVLLEQLLKTYSVLQLNQHIELCHDRIVYLLQVTELKPSNVVMIRNTDLEVEFDESKMVTPQTPITPSNPFITSSINPSPSPSASEYDYIITDSDGENIVINGEDLPNTKVMIHKDRILKNKSTSSLTSEMNNNNNNNNQLPPPSSSSSSKQKQQQNPIQIPPPPSTSTSLDNNYNNNNDIPIEGISLPSPSPPPDYTQCNHCLHYIPNSTFEMHELRCSKNNNYKGKICDICKRIITINEEDRHVHCKICKNLFTKSIIDQHILLTHEKLKCIKCNKEFNGGEEYILHTSDMKVCPVCEMKLLSCEYNQHFVYCASQTMKCDYCRKYITYLKIEEHFYKCHRGKECPVKIGNFNANNYEEEMNRRRRKSKEMEKEEEEDNEEEEDSTSSSDNSSNDEENKDDEENEYDNVKSEDESENVEED